MIMLAKNGFLKYLKQIIFLIIYIYLLNGRFILQAESISDSSWNRQRFSVKLQRRKEISYKMYMTEYNLDQTGIQSLKLYIFVHNFWATVTDKDKKITSAWKRIWKFSSILRRITSLVCLLIHIQTMSVYCLKMFGT